MGISGSWDRALRPDIGSRSRPCACFRMARDSPGTINRARKMFVNAARQGRVIQRSPGRGATLAVCILLTVRNRSIYTRPMPRKVILGFGISLDGYIARRNGDLDFLVIDKEGESVMADFFAKIDTTIMGRKTASGWVKMRERGEMPETPGMANYVVSRRWKPGKREGFGHLHGPHQRCFQPSCERRRARSAGSASA